MKGLLLKDLYALRGYSKQYLLIFVAMFAYALFLRSSSFAMIYFIVMGSSLMLSSMSLDEAVSFNKFAFTMPVNTRMVVKSKYVLFLITIGIGVIFSALTNLFVKYLPYEANQVFEWGGLAVTTTVFMLINAFTFPFVFKLGVEKARYVNIFSMALGGVGVVGGFVLCERAGISIDAIEEGIPDGVLMAVCIAIAALALVISYFVSVAIVKNKRFA